MNPQRRHLAVLWLIIVLSTGLRVGWAVYASANHPETMVSPDTPSYVDSAEALAETGAFRESVSSAEPMFVRTPGYPAFLAVLRLLGLTSVRAVTVAQAVLGVVLTLLVYRLGRQLSDSPATALVAALLCAFSPLVLWSSTSVLTEFANSLCVAGFATAFVDAVRRAGERVGLCYAGAAGVALAAATLVRPTTYYFPVLLVPVAVLLLRSRVRWKRLLVSVGVLLLPTVVLIGGWQVRNAATGWFRPLCRH